MTLKYKPIKANVVNPVNEFFIPHACTDKLIVILSFPTISICGFHSFLIKRFNSLLSDSFPSPIISMTSLDLCVSKLFKIMSGTTNA